MAADLSEWVEEFNKALQSNNEEVAKKLCDGQVWDAGADGPSRLFAQLAPQGITLWRGEITPGDGD